ncbi:MAG TPA: DMT family transporter [Actinopolymorphaceae bacterium]
MSETTTDTRTITAPIRQMHAAAGLVTAFAIGGLVALQSRVNGELGRRLGDGVAAALISFGTGLVLLLLASILLPRVRRGLATVWRTVRADRQTSGGESGLRWWQCLGGVAGAFLVVSQSITVSILGVAAFTVAVVAGQAVSGLVVDKVGLGPGGPTPLSHRRVLGAVIALVAVVLTVSHRLGDSTGLALALLPALAGIGTAVQQGYNGRVARTASGDAYGAVAAGAINFIVGTAAICVVFAADVALRGLPHALPTEPWLYIGGACGVAFISVAAAAVRVIGVFVLGLGTIAGQLVGSLVLDLVLPAAPDAVRVTVVAGTLLALVAVVVAVPRLRRP